MRGLAARAQRAPATAEYGGVLPASLTTCVGSLPRRVRARFSTTSDALSAQDRASPIDFAERLGINRTALTALRPAVAERDARPTASAQPLVQGAAYFVAQAHVRLRRHGDSGSPSTSPSPGRPPRGSPANRSTGDSSAGAAATP